MVRAIELALEEPYMTATIGENVLFKLISIVQGGDSEAFLAYLGSRQRELVIRFLLWYTKDDCYKSDELASVLAMLKV